MELTTTYRFDATEYQKLYQVGILGDDDRVELLNGEIVIMSPIGYRHINTVSLLHEAFLEQSQRRYLVSSQSTFHLGQRSMPQPDLVLADRRVIAEGRYTRPAVVFLVVEVSDTSLTYDQGPKLEAYARAGIREVWIVDLTNDQIVAYREPQPMTGSFGRVMSFDRASTVYPLAFE